MTDYILLVAAVILLCLSLNKLSGKIGVPMLLAFILLGMLFGTDGILKIPFDNFEIAEQVCSISLIFIMFTVVSEQVLSRRGRWQEGRCCFQQPGYF